MQREAPFAGTTQGCLDGWAPYPKEPELERCEASTQTVYLLSAPRSQGSPVVVALLVGGLPGATAKAPSGSSSQLLLLRCSRGLMSHGDLGCPPLRICIAAQSVSWERAGENREL